MQDQSSKAVIVMAEADAKAAISKIRIAMENSLSSLDLAIKLTRRFDNEEGWKALGYRSLAACLAFELQMTRTRAYDIIDQMRASVLIEERTGEARTPTVREARREVGRGTVDASTESDHFIEVDTSPAPEPITRSPFGGGSAGPDFEYDTGEAVYRCRHCQRTGTVEQLARCLEPVRSARSEYE